MNTIETTRFVVVSNVATIRPCAVGDCHLLGERIGDDGLLNYVHANISVLAPILFPDVVSDESA